MRKWTQRSILVFVSLSLTLGLAELGTRILFNTALQLPNPALGYQLKPNFTGTYSGTPLSTNRYGFRGVDFPIPKPPNVNRILVLGDSVTFGLKVKEEDTYAVLLEKELNVIWPQDAQYQVINTAVPATDTPNHFAVLQQKSLRFCPDIILLGYFLNDAKDLLQESSSPQGLLERLNNGTKPMTRWLASRSHFFALFRDKSRIALIRLGFLGNERRDSVGYTRWIMDGYSEKESSAWNQNRIWLQRLADLAQSNDIPLVVAVFPFLGQAEGQAPNLQPQELVTHFFLNLGIPILDIQPHFATIPDPGTLYLPDDDSHLSTQGHRVVAQLIGTFLQTQGLLNKTPRVCVQIDDR